MNREIYSKYSKGLKTEADIYNMQKIYGLNTTEIKVDPIYKILIKEILSPFYIF